MIFVHNLVMNNPRKLYIAMAGGLPSLIYCIESLLICAREPIFQFLYNKLNNATHDVILLFNRMCSHNDYNYEHNNI